MGPQLDTIIVRAHEPRAREVAPCQPHMLERRAERTTFHGPDRIVRQRHVSQVRIRKRAGADSVADVIGRDVEASDVFQPLEGSV